MPALSVAFRNWRDRRARRRAKRGCPVTTTTSTFQTYDVNHVSGLFYVDLNLTQKVAVNDTSDAEFFFNVSNVFNRWPLLVPETGLAANSTYSDLLGRTFRVGARVKLR